jgi:hypothetical protein
MDVPYRKADGTRATIPDLTTLKALIENGEIAPLTPMYDVLRGAWCPASEHPLARAHFGPGPAPQAARGLKAEGAPRPALPTLPLPPMPWRNADLAAGAILLAGIALLLIAPRSKFPGSSLVDILGVATALGSLLAVALWGGAQILWRERRLAALPNLLFALPLAAFLVMATLVYRAVRVPQPHVATSPSPTPVRIGTYPPGDEKKADATGGASEEESGDALEAGRIVSSYLDGLERADEFFLNAYRQENPWAAFSSASSKNAASLKAARLTLQRVSALTERYVKSVEGVLDIVDLRIRNSKMTEGGKEIVTTAFREERGRILPELERFFEALRKQYSEAEQMLAFIESLEVSRLDVQGPFRGDADKETLRLYQQRLSEAANEVKSVEKSVNDHLKDSARELGEKLKGIR